MNEAKLKAILVHTLETLVIVNDAYKRDCEIEHVGAYNLLRALTHHDDVKELMKKNARIREYFEEAGRKL